MQWKNCYTFLKGFATGLEYNQLIIAMSIAKEQHDGQFRKQLINGEKIPYISHPVEIVTHLISLGIKDEDTLVVGMLHDVKEDCKISISEMKKRGISDKNCQSIISVSKSGKMKSEDKTRHFESILDNGSESTIVKIADRCHNISTMGNAFTIEKILEYIEETNLYIKPMAKLAKDKYPHLSNQITALNIHLDSVINMAIMYANK